MFGRLAPGATLEEAQSELTTLGRRTASDFSETHQHLRPQVMRYAKSFLDPSVWAGVASNLFVVMLLVLICANIALLMFARAATRESEIVVRTALGASRSRIITQLFSEALVLSGVAATIGLAGASWGLRWFLGIAEDLFLDGGRLPFWFSSRVSPATVVYAVVLALLCAAIAGVVPALKVTRGVGARLKETTAGGGGLRFGGVWTAVIIVQVAVTVAFPFIAFVVRVEHEQARQEVVGFPAREYLSMRLEMDREASGAPNDTSQAAFLARFRKTYEALEQRLAAEPGVTGVTFADRLPRMSHPWNQIEVDEGAVEPLDARGHRVSSVKIDVGYFDVLGAPIIAGRGFDSGDLAPDARAVIVNQSFIDRVLGRRNPLGRRVRYVANEASRTPTSDGPWYEIVGVSKDLGTRSGYGPMGIYHPIGGGGSYPLNLAVHVRGDPAAFAPRLRALATAVDPRLRLHSMMPLDEVITAELEFYEFWYWLTLAVSGIALLLSLSGIYSVMAFTLSRRTREIGVRIALGANRRRVIAAIFRRPLTQISLGVVAGAAVVGLMDRGMRGSVSATQLGMVFVYATLMAGVCALACILPTRRALRIQPTEALRAD